MWLEGPPYGIAPWKLNPTNTITEPPVGEFRVDSTTAATALAVSEEDRLGTDQEAELLGLVVEGDRLVLQQARAAGRYQVFDIGAVTDHGTWWEFLLTMVGSSATLVDGQDYVWTFRHAAADDDETSDVNPPATLVPADQLDELVEDLVTALAGEVNADPLRDADKLDRAARAAIDDVATFIDFDGGDLGLAVYATSDDVNRRVFAGLVDLAAAILKRPGFAYGAAGYDEADPLAVRARGAVLAAIGPGQKRRWGVA